MIFFFTGNHPKNDYTLPIIKQRSSVKQYSRQYLNSLTCIKPLNILKTFATRTEASGESSFTREVHLFWRIGRKIFISSSTGFLSSSRLNLKIVYECLLLIKVFLSDQKLTTSKYNKTKYTMDPGVYFLMKTNI